MMQVALPIAPSFARRRRPSPTAWTSDDALLAARLADGDHEAIAYVHSHHGPAVLGLLRKVLSDPMAAEDVFQQVMTEAWMRAESFDATRGSMTTWLLSMARSRAIDELRRRRPDPVDPATIDAQGPPDTTFDDAVHDWEMAHLLSLLPEDERTVIELRFRYDLSQTEIAGRTGLALGTVKTRMNRALKRLRDHLGAREDRA